MTRASQGRLDGARGPGKAAVGAGASRELAVGLLGPFGLWLGGQALQMTTGRLRALLAVLAMSPGHAVSVDRLARAIWGNEPPDNARRTVQTYVTRLRSLLGAELIDTTTAGYVLRVDPEQVDALRFVRLLEVRPRDAGCDADPMTQRARLMAALGLWRGTPFEDVPSPWLAESEAAQLSERYLAALEQRIDLDLAAGSDRGLVAELLRLTTAYPLREPLWVRLLIALQRSGRRAEALATYETVRVRIAEDLGVDPGPELQRTYADLLAGRKPKRSPTR
jgi:DNA-binding SARP family transcriptional activator